MRQAAYRFNNDLRYREGPHTRNTQFTPDYVLDPVRRDLAGIGLDPCTTAENPVEAARFFTVADDGLERPWMGPGWFPSVFVNPPYGKAREPWARRCAEQGRLGQRVILLMPAATDTRCFQAAASTSTAVVFIRGRVKFGVLRPNRRQVAASHPSALIGWNVVLDECATLGLRIRVANSREPRNA